MNNKFGLFVIALIFSVSSSIIASIDFDSTTRSMLLVIIGSICGFLFFCILSSYSRKKSKPDEDLYFAKSEEDSSVNQNNITVKLDEKIPVPAQKIWHKEMQTQHTIAYLGGNGIVLVSLFISFLIDNERVAAVLGISLGLIFSFLIGIIKIDRFKCAIAKRKVLLILGGFFGIALGVLIPIIYKGAPDILEGMLPVVSFVLGAASGLLIVYLSGLIINANAKRIRLATVGNTKGEISSASEPSLCHSFNSKNWYIRALAATGIGMLISEKEDSIRKLINAFSDKNKKVQLIAFSAAAKIHNVKPSLIKSLFETSDPKDKASKFYLDLLMYRFKDFDDDMIHQLINMSISKDKLVSKYAHDALVTLGPKSFPHLLKSLKDSKYTKTIIKVLEKSSSEHIIKSLDTVDDGIAVHLIKILGRIESDSNNIIDKFATLIKNGQKKVAQEAINNIPRLTGDTTRLISTLIQLLESKKIGRNSVIDALGSIKCKAKEAVPQLVTFLDIDKNAAAAARALGNIQNYPEICIQPLINLLHNEDADIRNAAVVALGRFGKLADEALPEILKALKDSEAVVRDHAVAAITAIRGY